MNEEQTIAFCANLMAGSEISYLTTIDESGFPITRAIYNFKNPVKFPFLQKTVTKEGDPFFSLIGTNTSSKKVEEIRNNPKANLYFCVPEKVHGLSLTGTLIFRDELELKKALWGEGWEVFYPQGYTDPDYCVLQLIPTYARGWNSQGKFSFTISYVDQAIQYQF